MATCVISATATNLIPVRDEADRDNSERGLVQRAQRGDGSEPAEGVAAEALLHLPHRREAGVRAAVPSQGG